MISPVRQSYQDKLRLTYKHLTYSLNDVEKLAPNVSTASEEDLKAWEAFSMRFGRCADLLLNKWLRALAFEHDPAFEGSFRDLLHFGQKLGVIEDEAVWMRIRVLRNLVTHEYRDEGLELLFKELRSLAPQLLNMEQHFDAS